MATVHCVNHVGTNRSSQLTSGSSLHLLPHYNVRLYTQWWQVTRINQLLKLKRLHWASLTYQLPINVDIIPHTVGELGECELYLRPST